MKYTFIFQFILFCSTAQSIIYGGVDVIAQMHKYEFTKPPTKEYEEIPILLVGAHLRMGFKFFGLKFHYISHDKSRITVRDENNPEKFNTYKTKLKKYRAGLNILPGGKSFMMSLTAGVDQTNLSFIKTNESGLVEENKIEPRSYPFTEFSFILREKKEQAAVRFGGTVIFIDSLRYDKFTNQIVEIFIGISFFDD